VKKRLILLCLFVKDGQDNRELRPIKNRSKQVLFRKRLKSPLSLEKEERRNLNLSRMRQHAGNVLFEDPQLESALSEDIPFKDSDDKKN